MKIIALYKTFGFEDWLECSLDSIYNKVSNIVFVNSDVSWNGINTGNEVNPIIEQWKKANDRDNKVIILKGSWTDQKEQYEYGIKFIQNNLHSDYIQIIDQDEIWDDENYNKALSIIKSHPEINNFTCRMKTYIKSPYFLVDPAEPCAPVVFVKSNIKDFTGVRGNLIRPRFIMQDVYFHHMCYVRINFETIKRKFKTSETGDGNASVNFEKWKKEKWDQLPNVEDIHPTKDYEFCWKKIKVITKDDLPIYIGNNKILGNF